MRFVKNNFLLLAFCFLASVVAINSEKAIAGGDPSIKDKKVTNNQNNIKQHDHDKVYVNDQKKLSSSKLIDPSPTLSVILLASISPANKNFSKGFLISLFKIFLIILSLVK